MHSQLTVFHFRVKSKKTVNNLKCLRNELRFTLTWTTKFIHGQPNQVLWLPKGQLDTNVISNPASALKNLHLWCEFHSCLIFIIRLLIKNFLTTLHMHCLSYVLLSYILIYNLEASFHFHLTFLQSNVLNMFTIQ